MNADRRRWMMLIIVLLVACRGFAAEYSVKDSDEDFSAKKVVTVEVTGDRPYWTKEKDALDKIWQAVPGMESGGKIVLVDSAGTELVSYLYGQNKKPVSPAVQETPVITGLIKDRNPIEDLLLDLVDAQESPPMPKISFAFKNKEMTEYSGSGLKRRMWRFLVLGENTVPPKDEMKAVALWWYENAAPDYYDEITVVFHLEGLPFEHAVHSGYTFKKGKGLTDEVHHDSSAWLRDNWDRLKNEERE